MVGRKVARRAKADENVNRLRLSQKEPGVWLDRADLLAYCLPAGRIGSGRWRSHLKKTTVEECIAIPPSVLKSALANGPGWGTTGTSFQYGELVDSISCVAELFAGELAVRLKYTRTINEEKRDMNYVVSLIYLPVHFGGKRGFFLCPLYKEGSACLYRVTRLYLPPGAAYFGCRRCHDLTHRSAQESHSFDGLYGGIAKRIGGVTAEDIKVSLARATQRKT